MVDKNWDCINDQKFLLIHLIILRLNSKSLAAELEENPNAVHLKDAQGPTARAQKEDMKLLHVSLLVVRDA
ncbi:hypothetical protein ColLi_12346 [Colletotrichum liriopes]|uniref:Uncharacterized protein n=1 Tax=Colletotrichum liriopes TaxID=708192 RepID=A0AA37GY81_9PEZI|nr:hypothetical protein ColLi_12346 [Colletotrichum liriopes]